MSDFLAILFQPILAIILLMYLPWMYLFDTKTPTSWQFFGLLFVSASLWIFLALIVIDSLDGITS